MHIAVYKPRNAGLPFTFAVDINRIAVDKLNQTSGLNRQNFIFPEFTPIIVIASI